ncbi:MAG TPA: single-stranded DNA-binding protein [Bacteroidales bacterium]|jgi:single-strand DNA-binding protein|nr:single-stranded DNA-binding protein [Bacteroidales bacterium]OQB61958.1 MAG: Single-stranded DNA-binding protein [Bacteroidetes bacterium ADurb.Bin145]HQE67485.1 single-stranded DNA-binding protein [Bacillota bacterium]NMD02082.1 single-stranded DNA-binding protein [Bacteroidales bacterium]HOU01926.1 single-stranded DNA-binding protein [Bacteroidales bacterium]
MSINKVILVGNVGKDPVVRYFDKGVAKATFPLATSETYTNQQGETITSTEWHNIVLWRSLAEVAEKTIKKGTQVYLVGRIKTRSYVDKDGNNKYITEILADTLMVLEKKQSPGSYPSQSDSARNESQNKKGPVTQINEPDDFPYRGSNNTEAKDWNDNSTTNGGESGPGGTFSNEPSQGQSEDDLPF